MTPKGRERAGEIGKSRRIRTRGSALEQIPSSRVCARCNVSWRVLERGRGRSVAHARPMGTSTRTTRKTKKTRMMEL
jgi:hypothetical protein